MCVCVCVCGKGRVAFFKVQGVLVCVSVVFYRSCLAIQPLQLNSSWTRFSD